MLFNLEKSDNSVRKDSLVCGPWCENIREFMINVLKRDVRDSTLSLGYDLKSHGHRYGLQSMKIGYERVT